MKINDLSVTDITNLLKFSPISRELHQILIKRIDEIKSDLIKEDRDKGL